MRWISGNQIFASVTGDTIIPHFLSVYSYDCPHLPCNEQTCTTKKKTQQYNFLPGTGDKIECSSSRIWHPIPCMLTTPRLTRQCDFSIWGHPHSETIPHFPELICMDSPAKFAGLSVKYIFFAFKFDDFGTTVLICFSNSLC